MSQENKYLQEFLNLLGDDQVFHSYLTNTFMLNQMNVLFKDLNNGKKTEDDVEKEMKNLMKSIEILSPGPMGSVEGNLSSKEFYVLLKNVKHQTILNLAERRRN